MFQFNRDFAEVFCGARSIDVSRTLNSSLQTFDAGLEDHKAQISIE